MCPVIKDNSSKAVEWILKLQIATKKPNQWAAEVTATVLKGVTLNTLSHYYFIIKAWLKKFREGELNKGQKLSYILEEDLLTLSDLNVNWNIQVNVKNKQSLGQYFTMTWNVQFIVSY